MVGMHQNAYCNVVLVNINRFHFRITVTTIYILYVYASKIRTLFSYHDMSSLELSRQICFLDRRIIVKVWSYHCQLKPVRDSEERFYDVVKNIMYIHKSYLTILKNLRYFPQGTHFCLLISLSYLSCVSRSYIRTRIHHLIPKHSVNDSVYGASYVLTWVGVYLELSAIGIRNIIGI